ncbi:hypothetical protein JAAARDRAFT_67213 [Jaapia argillacea MUCL 33604]|uniref:Mitotic checkpoint regulator, MAD2B-interacting-domain-containing protein n=1 Tax=Jaapia argillacea MUCL 33604 TaxID=933084 RepID=A0A067Q1B7_9AGAM|nr:hypothetical protein JAAARDRAFT_67213 [Jaapia argillacea MUCL 33604]
MLGIEDYGSDEEDDNEVKPSTQSNQTVKPLAVKLPPTSKKSTFSLPAPTKEASTSSGIALPPKAKKPPKKIAIGLPDLPSDDDDDLKDDRPPAKKQRLGSGVGRSSLLAMLPAPKQKGPPQPVQSERVLGGGRGPGLVFTDHASRTVTAPSPTVIEEVAYEGVEDQAPSVQDQVDSTPSLAFLPPHLVKGKPNISTEGPPKAKVKANPAPAPKPALAIDFFSLGAASSATEPSSSKLPSSSQPSTLPSLSAAPQVEEFIPPEPTPTDPYPGYYMLPSGQWAAYDADYYNKCYKKWKFDYDAHVRALEKGMAKGFEGADEQAQDYNALEEMERAKEDLQAKEERKALTQGAQGAPVAPRMNIKGAALAGRARSRHQLSTLLTEAYSNREALEEKIAEGRRNRKEAGMKYGF